MIASTDHPRRSRLGAAAEPRSSLRLQDEFRLLVDGEAIALPHSVERVVAFLGVSQAPVSRARVAAALWPDVVDRRAYGDLRSALWRLRRITGVIQEVDHRLALTPDVRVDVLELIELAQSLIADPCSGSLERLRDVVCADDILPGWDEEWLVAERERFRMTRLRALERSADALIAVGDYVGALEVALASIANRAISRIGSPVGYSDPSGRGQQRGGVSLLSGLPIAGEDRAWNRPVVDDGCARGAACVGPRRIAGASIMER